MKEILVGLAMYAPVLVNPQVVEDTIIEAAPPPPPVERVQEWPPGPGAIMPMPPRIVAPRRWNDCRGEPCYQQWRGWEGRQVEPRYEYPGAPGRRCRNVYGSLVPC